jgi:hypothetical protein
MVQCTSGSPVDLDARREQRDRAGGAASTAADRVNALMTSEIDALRGELERERTEHAASRDAAERMLQRVTVLESQLAAQERKLRSELN